MILSIIAIAAFIVGGGVGFLVFRLLTSKKIDSAKNRADKIIADAKVEGKEFLVSAKDEALKYKEEIKKELAPKEKEIAEIERSLRNRELGIDKKFDQLEAERKALSKRSDDVEQLKQTLRD